MWVSPSNLHYRIIDSDAYIQGPILSVHVSCMVELKLKSQLFNFSHEMVSLYPNNAISWYSVACYYYLLKNYEGSSHPPSSHGCSLVVLSYVLTSSTTICEEPCFLVDFYWLLPLDARLYFNKCTICDPNFGPGWLGWGHSFAVEGEHDQVCSQPPPLLIFTCWFGLF